MSVSDEAAAEVSAADHPSGQLFARAEFDAAPAPACHSLIRRLPAGTDAAAVRANLATLTDRHPVLRAVQLFDETLHVDADDGVAHKRRTREAGRAVNGAPVIARAVVFGYTDGTADLVLVAHRRAVDRRALDQLATALADPAQTVTLPAQTAATASRHNGPPELPWGLGDPTGAGRTDTLTLTAPAVSGEATPAVLVAATAIALARYGGTERADFTLITGGPEAADTPRTVSLPIGDTTHVSDLLDGAAHIGATGGEPPSAMPAVGCLLYPGRPGDLYRPALAPVFPVTLAWQYDADGTASGVLHYDTGVLDPVVARQFAGHIARLVEALALAPAGTPVGAIDLVDPEEAAAIIAAGRTPAVGDAVVAPVHELFRKVAAGQPDAPALSDGERTLSYAEVDARSDAVAGALRAHGIAPGSRVGVCLDRDADLVIALLGVLKAGAAYVPMDLTYPAERLIHTVTDSGARVVLSRAADFPVVDGVTVLHPSEVSGTHGEPITDPGVSADDIAYVIYTSGSTGRPKGVAVPHRNVGALLAATTTDLRLGPSDTWTLFHSSAFDFSVWEIWGALLTGGHLVVVPYFVSRNPEEFHDLLVRHRVTVLNQTPSAFAMLKEIDLQSAADLAVRLVVFGGEPLDVRILQDWFRGHPHTRCRVVNMFGITETTVHVTSQTVTPQDVGAGSRSVGRPLPGWSVSVRDTAGRVQPFGVPGEIYVGGAGVADHYLNQKELTAERFVADPVTGERVYRSGDLGRLRPDGRLDHLGRIDGQVKVRGFRIELGEIRSVLLEDQDVTAATVVLGGDAGDAADVRLDAYLVPKHDGVSVEDIRRRAARYLPDYMVPTTFTLLSELPLTVNGKVDVSGLVPATPAARTSPVAEAEAGQPTDDRVLRVWREILGQDVGPDDDFFAFGGNSLLAVRLSGALRRAGLPPVSLRELYVYPTAAEVTALIADRELTEEPKGRPGA
ncbi:non-ribosomal peptide synthetase [Streptomyces sp. NPDC055060]